MSYYRRPIRQYLRHPVKTGLSGWLEDLGLTGGTTTTTGSPPSGGILNDIYAAVTGSSGTPANAAPATTSAVQSLGCGRGQVSDPNKSVNGYAQCLPRSGYQSSDLVDPNADPAVAKVKGSTSSNVISAIFGALTGQIGTSTMGPATSPVIAAQTGMSTGAKLAIAGGAVALVAFMATRN